MPTAVSPEILEQITEIYERGLYLQAFEASKQLGPLQELKDVAAQVLGGRLANNLGAPRLGSVLHRLAFQQAPTNHEVVLFYVLTMAARRGPLATMQLVESLPLMNDAPDVLRADWLALQARTLALLRDFESAEAKIEAALELQPERAWIWVEKSTVLECEDRHEEGVEAARRALELRPSFRPASQHLAYRLVQLNRDDEALAVLEKAVDETESAAVLMQLAALHHELKNYDEARRIYDGIERFWPLMHLSKDGPKFGASIGKC